MKVQWIGQMTDGRVVRARDPLPDDPPPLGKRWNRAWRCTPGGPCEAPRGVTCVCKAVRG